MIDASSGEVLAAPEEDTRQLRLPMFEGYKLDIIEVGFSGSVTLDLQDPNDLAFFQELRLGRAVDMHVSGVVTRRPHALSHDPQGRSVVKSRAGIEIDGIDR